MAGPNVHQLTEMTDTPEDGDEFYLVDGGVADKKVAFGTLRGPRVTTLVDYVVTRAGEVVFASGTVTITLAPAAKGWPVKVFNIGTGEVTVLCQGSDTIEGVASIKMAYQYDAISLEGDGGTLYVKD